MPNGIYHGTLWTDGEGNLLAGEGEFEGYPVAFHEGSYVFVQPGEPSHNERYHQQFVEFSGTVDESMTDDPGLVNAGGEHGNMHHFEIQEDDPHYDPDAENKTRVKTLPEKTANTITGHTEAYRD